MQEKGIEVDMLSKALAQELSKISKGVQSELKDIIDSAAEEGERELKASSPKKTGAYAKGWTHRVHENPTVYNVILFNRAKPFLTHLLEKGHAKRGGKGRVKAYVHIAPVREKIDRDIDKKLKNLLGKV